MTSPYLTPTEDDPFPALTCERSAALRDSFKASLPAGEDIWVFGYGSLMWHPGFPHQETQRALVRGYHRAFCVYSHRYRGTPKKPGLVLGLDHGGECHGMIFRVAAGDVGGVMDYLWDREMVTGVYNPVSIEAETPEGTVICRTFVADREHPQYAGRLSMEESAALIATAHGARGPNTEYLFNTVRHLDDLGIRDEALHSLMERLGL